MHKYECRHCGKIVEREQEQAWIKSYCGETGQTTHLTRVQELPENTEEVCQAIIMPAMIEIKEPGVYISCDICNETILNGKVKICNGNEPGRSPGDIVHLDCLNES